MRPNTASGEFPKGSIPCGSERGVERGGDLIDNKPINNSASRYPSNGVNSNSLIAVCEVCALSETTFCNEHGRHCSVEQVLKESVQPPRVGVRCGIVLPYTVPTAEQPHD